jgi:hypothetical protein
MNIELDEVIVQAASDDARERFGLVAQYKIKRLFLNL